MNTRGMVFAVAALSPLLAAVAAGVKVDFSAGVGPVRPALHSSGFAALMNRATSGGTDKQIAEMGFDYVRTHDLALINAGSRVVDNHFIFPLPHADAQNPSNYYFEATDYLLELQRDLGLKIFYRLGTSIEHTGQRHFNARIPENFDVVAENFAATIRHYNRGWANGREWGIGYWEIWNEPDGHDNMWSFDGQPDRPIDAKRQKLFVDFFVRVLKRLKSEFPDVKIGGPALCSYNEPYLRALLVACRKAGVKPDFLSWHYYGNRPDHILMAADQGKALAASLGMDGIEFIINEWHYMPKGGFKAIRSKDPKVAGPAKHGPASINGIDSAAFTLTTLARLQSSGYSQAYFYGCRHVGNWGYRDDDGNLNKNFYALKAFGSLMKGGYDERCAVSGETEGITALAVKGADGRRALLVVDYRGKDRDIAVDVAGLPDGAAATAVVLSDKLDLKPVEVSFAAGKLALRKPDAHSAAFLVTFK